MLLQEEINLAGKAMRDGKIAVFPTETVYGIGVVFDSEIAYKNLIKIKKRSPDKPFSMMFESVSQAERFIVADPRRIALMEAFLPGQVTFLAKARLPIPHSCDLGTGVIGIRVPASETAAGIIASCGKPCLVTSANIAGKPSALSLEEAKAYFPEGVAAFVHGECSSKLATTIIDITGDEPRLVRQGAVSLETVNEEWRKLG